MAPPEAGIKWFSRQACDESLGRGAEGRHVIPAAAPRPPDGRGRNEKSTRRCLIRKELVEAASNQKIIQVNDFIKNYLFLISDMPPDMPPRRLFCLFIE
jgi:hypothetical protein